MKNNSIIHLLLQLLHYLTVKRRVQLGLLLIFMVVGALAEMVTLGAAVTFLSVLSEAKSCPIRPFLCDFSLAQASGIFLLVAILSSLIRLSLLRVSTRWTFALGADLGNEVYRKALYQPYLYHVTHNTSDMIAGINKISVLVQGVINPLMLGAVAFILGIAILVTILSIDFVMASIAMAVFSLLYVTSSILTRKKLHANSKVIAQAEVMRIQAIQEGLGGIREVLINGTQNIYAKRFSEVNNEQRRAQSTNTFVNLSPRHVIEFSSMALMVGLAWWISLRGNVALAIPVLGAMALGAQKMLPQMQQIYSAWASVNGNRALLQNVLELLEQCIPAEYAYLESHDKDLHRISKYSKAPIIELRSVCFKYGISGPVVLDDINLTIVRGSRVGFIGKTGSGKSTLIDIMMGLLEPMKGEILIDGELLKVQNKRRWQSRIAHVPQTIFLSDATIRENIAFGVSPELINFERVRQVAHQAQMDEFIMTLPQQYEEKVGERGVRLSGGQRQRLGIARALYKMADVLVLDEATSALDDLTESAVMDAIGSLGPDVTVFMIAHRLTTLRGCDLIVEMESGKIARVGSYNQVVLR